MIFWISLMTTIALLTSGCASNLIVKNCYDIVAKNGKRMNGEVCKSTMPWADFEEAGE